MQKPLDRRKFLTVAGVALSCSIGAGYWQLSRSTAADNTAEVSDARNETDVPQMGGPPSDAENIVDHGAEPNPSDPDLESAVRNTDALRAAATAAGRGGTVYVPSGTYFLGQEARTSNIGFGRNEPAGISMIGDGPGASTLALTEHLDDGGESHVLFKYRDVEHGTVDVRNLTIDGNYENLGNLIDVGRASRAFEMEGTGHITFRNVQFRGIYSTALRLREFSASIDQCTFEEIGIGGKDHGGSGHAVETYVGSGESVTITRSVFKRIGSFAVNWRYNDGTVVIEDCHVTGTGTGIVKLSAGDRLEIRNSYLQPHTEWLTEHISTPDDGDPFHGRHLINRLFERAERVPTVVLENVEFRDCTHEAFMIRQAPIELQGDMIALHNASGQYDTEKGNNAVFRDYAWTGSAIRNADIGRLSVHDSPSDVFETPNSNGVIETLTRRGNAGLGTVGEIEIHADAPGDPLRPTVVSRDEVGHIPPDRSDGGD
jgi:hypothetical protein